MLQLLYTYVLVFDKENKRIVPALATLVAERDIDVDKFCKYFIENYETLASPQVEFSNRDVDIKELDTKRNTNLAELVDVYEYNDYDNIMNRLTNNIDKVSAVIPYGRIKIDTKGEDKREKIAYNLIKKRIMKKRRVNLIEIEGSTVFSTLAGGRDIIHENGVGAVFGGTSWASTLFAVVGDCVVYADKDSARVAHYYTGVSNITDAESFTNYVFRLIEEKA